MTLKGTWTLYFAHEPTHAERIEIHAADLAVSATGSEPEYEEESYGIYFTYASGRTRMFPWASLREARWEPAQNG